MLQTAAYVAARVFGGVIDQPKLFSLLVVVVVWRVVGREHGESTVRQPFPNSLVVERV